jgi:hypothetical protein
MEWSATRPGRFTRREIATGTEWIGDGGKYREGQKYKNETRKRDKEGK